MRSYLDQVVCVVGALLACRIGKPELLTTTEYARMLCNYTSAYLDSLMMLIDRSGDFGLAFARTCSSLMLEEKGEFVEEVEAMERRFEYGWLVFLRVATPFCGKPPFYV